MEKEEGASPEDVLDSEEELDEEEEDPPSMDESQSPTLRLGESPPAKGKAKAKSSKEKKESKGAESMRDLYWTVVHQKQKELKKKNPDLGAKEILKMARAECLI